MSFFPSVSFVNHSFDLNIMDFNLFLAVRDKFFQLNDSGTVSWLLGLDRIFKLSFCHLYLGNVGGWKELNG